LIEAVREAAPTPPSYLCSGVDTRFDALIHRALAKESDDRFENAAAFADALRAWADTRGLVGGQASLGTQVSEMFSAERDDAARLQASFVPDDDPTPTSDRQSYTRIVGVDDPYPRTLTGFESASEGVRMDTGSTNLGHGRGDQNIESGHSDGSAIGGLSGDDEA
jgi:hypothetical protein